MTDSSFRQHRFETWAKGQGLLLSKTIAGTYVNDQTAGAWRAWQHLTPERTYCDTECLFNCQKSCVGEANGQG